MCIRDRSLTAQKKAMLPGLKERACLNKLIERMEVEVPAAMALSLIHI